MFRICWTFIIASLVIGCREQKKQTRQPTVQYSDILLKRTALDIEPSLQKIDSLQVIFYDDPDGDSLRYSRYYRFVNTSDKKVAAIVKHSLSYPVEQRSLVKPCRSEGKMYLLVGEQPLKTIYFSTRCDSCCYLYFIKDGGFCYLKPSKDVLELLKNLKLKATKE